MTWVAPREVEATTMGGVVQGDGEVRAVGATPQAAQRSPTAPPTWTLREDWRLRTGGIEILQIQGLTVTADGGILVAAGQDRQVLRFAPNGRHVFTTGREGRGPGEYAVPQLARPTGDSVWVFDILGRRLTVVGPNGRFVRSVDLTGGRKLPADGSPRSGRLTVGFIPVFVSSQVQDATTSVLVVRRVDVVTGAVREHRHTFRPVPVTRARRDSAMRVMRTIAPSRLPPSDVLARVEARIPAAGVHVAWVTKPPKAFLRAATASHLWGVLYDDDGFPHVLRYAVVR